MDPHTGASTRVCECQPKKMKDNRMSTDVQMSICVGLLKTKLQHASQHTTHTRTIK